MKAPFEILTGDVVTHLPQLPARSIHAIVTSPPYWSLRNYGTEPTAWPAMRYQPMAGLPEFSLPAETVSLGRETRLEAYIGHLVLVARALHRVLRDDGTLWLNIGDTYASGGWGYDDKKLLGSTARSARAALSREQLLDEGRDPRTPPPGLKPKDLVGIPWRVALALQAEGWYLRADIIWHKLQPMPEPVEDRPTKAHEYLFLLTKSERYFYDKVAILEPFADERQGADGGAGERIRNFGGRTDGLTRPAGIDPSANGGRNKRSVWSFGGMGGVSPTGSHIAAFPRRLPEPCILAGTSAGGVCADCGAPRERSGDVAAPWKASCDCGAGIVPALVLDPFSGSGTTASVAVQHGRRALGVELNPTDADASRARLAEETAQQSMFPLHDLAR